MSVPIGAVGILCIRRTMNSGRRHGYITGLAGATADFIFSTVIAFGIKLVSEFVTSHQHEIRLVGGALLVVLGIVLLRSRRTASVEKKSALEETGIYFSTFAIAITNPLVMFAYAAVMSAIGVAKYVHEYLSLSLLVVGIFFGAFLWFVFIANLVHRFHMMVTEDKLMLVNRIAGVVLILIGLSAIWGGVHGLF